MYLREEIDSELNHGTQMHIYLPVAKGTPAKKFKPSREIFSGEGATVLIIENEKPLIRATRQRLARLNYNILEATTGKMAFEVLNSHAKPIDAVLLDMRLPDIDGDRLFYKMRKLRPDLKILLCSGFAIDEPVKKLLRHGAHGFLQKPFSLATLSEKLKYTISSPKNT